MGRTPPRPSSSDRQKVGTSSPMGLTTPIPVITTRRDEAAIVSRGPRRPGRPLYRGMLLPRRPCCTLLWLSSSGRSRSRLAVLRPLALLARRCQPAQQVAHLPAEDEVVVA